jgi:biofilm PGA synthesis N-glycosyltransferase PgaC
MIKIVYKLMNRPIAMFCLRGKCSLLLPVKFQTDLKIMETSGDTGLYILMGLFLTVFATQLFYYLFFYLSINRKPLVSVVPTEKPPVSMVICARNEAENLQKYLPLFLEQDYPNYEVIVVNDCSDDESEYVLNELQKKYNHLRVTKIVKDMKFIHGKKLALTVGIKAAHNDWLLLTDADCRPESANWISAMASHFNEGNRIVLGYGGFNYRKGLLNNFIRYDSFFIALQYLTFAMRGIPYMGVGRNLAYRKSTYNSNRGFSSHHDLQSGDDDLFVNAVAKPDSTAVEYSLEAHTHTESKDRFSRWWFQKKRHLTTGWRYKLRDRLLLCAEPFSRIAFYGLFIVLLIFGVFPWILVSAFLLRTSIQLVVFNFALRRLNEKYLLLSSLLYDILLPFIYMGLIISNLHNHRGAKWTSGQTYPKKHNRIISLY